MNLLIILDQTHHVLLFKKDDGASSPKFRLPDASLLQICQEKCIHFKHITNPAQFPEYDQIDIYIYPAFINPCFPSLENNSIECVWIPIWEISENMDFSPINGQTLQKIYTEIILEGYFPPNFKFDVWYFGMEETLANELVKLVVSGKKTATASYFDVYSKEEESLPQAGMVSVIVNWPGIPLVIIETTDVQILPFNQVSAEHAALEGEGDLSLSYWRQVHEEVFRKDCQNFKLQFSEEAKVVCERFRVLKKLNE
ncbi:hypothetical protein NEF87_003251 [Candidatus Lokiarchaeum ossiferum]|uniref:ASCH domain-containing protein n=1 Tax=Candidatus Lokiarchaeum ossiferum TaxID=2951803 RepID=A0ABY6HWK2_9ARCH|nr:hypothetical protein NEF87_003251 [Candidatus Lokiarchaeum sp. B-35]